MLSKLLVISLLIATWAITYVEDSHGQTRWQKLVSRILDNETVEQARLQLNEKEIEIETIARSSLGVAND